MHDSMNKTVGDRLEHYKTCMDTCIVIGIGLAGSVTCFIAGALVEDIDNFEMWRSFFFRTLAVSTIVIGSCWLFLEKQRGKIQHEIDQKKMQLEDSLDSSELPFFHRYFVHLTACASSLFAVGYILLQSLWSHAFDWPRGLHETARLYPLAGATVVGVVVFWVGNVRYNRKQRAASGEGPNWTSRFSPSNPVRSSLNCAAVLSISKRLSARTKLVGAVLLGQLAVVSYDALENARPFFGAAFFTSVLVSALFVGLVRLAQMQASRRVKNGIDAGRFTRDDIPESEAIWNLERLSPRILDWCLVIPPVLLAFGIFSDILPHLEPFAHLLSFFVLFAMTIWILERWNESKGS